VIEACQPARQFAIVADERMSTECYISCTEHSEESAKIKFEVLSLALAWRTLWSTNGPCLGQNALEGLR